MNRKDKIDVSFGAENRFNLVPTVAAPFRATEETEFEKLKTRLLKELLNEKPDPELNTPLRRAATEAAGLAWATSFPLLFFPALLNEKATAAARHHARQREINWTSPRFMEKAA